ncbi:MAG TPA: hypothetical protein VGR70_02735 [Stellaceae bacterium]|nr:hypothetical protein [Stellaceae bacterium]
MHRVLGALAVAFTALAIAAQAMAAIDDHDFAGPVPGIPDKTWIDLLSQIFPDIAVDERGYATASKVIDLRSIGAGDESWIGCGDKIQFQDRDARPIRLSGRDYVVVTVMIEDDCVGPIGLFDASGKLVDAVNVKGDQHVSFSGDYVRPLGADGALVIASLWHDNSSQSYDISSLILARPEGLSSIGDVFALGSRDCDGKTNSTVTEEAAVRVVPDGNPLARIDVAVERDIQKLGSDCETQIGRAGKTIFTGAWRWNAQKKAYEPHTKELKLLDDWNQKRS